MRPVHIVRDAFGWLLLQASLAIQPRSISDQRNGLALLEPGARRRVALVFHLDASADSIAHLIADTKLLRRVFDRVVYVVDHTDFSVLSAQGLCFEYMPPRAAQMQYAPSEAWSAFLAGRRELLIAKWEPLLVTSFGRPLEDVIADARHHEQHRLG